MHKPYTLEIQVPPRLQRLLAQGGSNHSGVLSAITEFSVWLSDNKTPLFFEYTDHGIAHVTNVLKSVESLVPETAWEILSPYDAEAIISAVLLHDCAMHLSVEGFRSLIKDREAPESPLFGREPSWATEYKRFEQEAMRWDAKRLISVFGDADPAQPISEEGPLSDRQKLLVGEFLRRNHARLAHEIAIDCVPGPSGADKVFSPFSSFPEKRRDLYGYLARSHNMSIRGAVDGLQKISRRKYLDVYCPYVMALLRVADYIQIDSARAPTQILQLRGLKSPVSRQEWAKHHAVLELHQWGDDPEALNVVASPPDVTIFVGLRALFKDLQRELDESWATLGEVYGRVPQLSALGLSVRRLVSNLDDAAQYETTGRPPYLPEEVRLTTSSAELLNLLVGPLYGNRPSIGVRELVQNAVDACSEMSHQSAKHASEYAPLIEVEVDVATSGKGTVRVTDNGVGMTIRTIKDFFLTAGASFRRSAWWAAEYANEQNKSLVRRSGRFGVGSLAAFLIGPRMTVITRSYSDETGLGFKFSVSPDDDLIQISRVECEVGTSIEVAIVDAEVMDGLLDSSPDFSDWFLYESPQLIYRENSAGEWVEREPRFVVSADQADAWVAFHAPDFEALRWSPARVSRYGRRPGRLACNGIFVTEYTWNGDLPEIRISPDAGAYRVHHPDLLVDDRDGRLPLNVQRDGLVDAEYPFQQFLEESIATAYATRIIETIKYDADPANLRACALDLVAVRRDFSDSLSCPVAITGGGWIPLETEVFRRVGLKKFFLDYCESASFRGVISSLESDKLSGWTLVPLNLGSAGLGAVVGRFRDLIDKQKRTGHDVPYAVGEIKGIRVFIRKEALSVAKRKGGVPNFLMRTLVEYGEFNGWFVLDFGDCSMAEGECDWDARSHELTANAPETSRIFAFVWYDSLSENESSPIADAWEAAVPGRIYQIDGGSPPSDWETLREDDLNEDLEG